MSSSKAELGVPVGSLTESKLEYAGELESPLGFIYLLFFLPLHDSDEVLFLGFCLGLYLSACTFNTEVFGS